MTDQIDRLKTALAGRYAVERELGAGGMATVYLAEDVKHHRKVAVKVLRPDLAAALGSERFVREIEIAAGLTHPHIVPLYDSGEADGFLYYVLPYIEGESLREKLAREGELPIADAVRILRDVVDALTDAHAHGIVHRDIKPDNVMLTKHHAVVTDFGVAKAVSEATGREKLTTVGVALGTPAYMAPEQAAADPHIDHRADIYAVGALAYELLTGHPPFTGSTPQMILSSHVTEVPDPVTKHRQAVPPALATVVMRCLEKKRADRWQSTEELLSQLDALATPSGGITPTGTQPVAAVDYDALARQAHPARVAALFGVASAGVLGLVYLIMIQLGLPDWVFLGAIALLAIGLPIMLLTGHHERQRALRHTTGNVVPTPASGIQRWLTWRKATLGGGVAFAALGVATAGYMAMRTLGIGPVGTLVASGLLEERDPIVVAQFQNRTSDSTLGLSLTEALRVGLSQSVMIDVADASVLSSALRRMGRNPSDAVDADLAREIAVREGIKAVVVPEVGPIGDGFVLSARLLAADGSELLALAETAKTSGELIDAIGRLSDALRERVGESLRTIRGNEGLARVTTSSLEALRAYSQGVRAFDANDYQIAIALFEQAVALDTGFAMAYRKLGVSVGNAGLGRRRAFQAGVRAFALRQRLTEHERLITEATYYWSVGEVDRVIPAYEAVLDRYPTDLVSLNNLGLVYEVRRDWATAEDLFRRAAVVHDNPIPHVNLLEVQVNQGKFAAADSTLDRFAAQLPENPSVANSHALLASAQKDYDGAERQWLALRQAARTNRRWRATADNWLADLASLRGRIGEAETYQREWEQVQGERRVANAPIEAALAMAWRDVWLRDQPERAWERVQRVLRDHPLDSVPDFDRPYFNLIRLAVAAGRLDDGRAFFAELETVWDSAEAEIPELRREIVPPRFQAMGALALAEGRTDDAIRLFRQYDGMISCSNCALMDLAAAYDQAGQADSVVAVLERYATLPRLDGLAQDAEYLPAALRRLGELHEARGDREKAAEYYSQFVELWQDADEELQPVVRGVRQRLARLVAER